MHNHALGCRTGTNFMTLAVALQPIKYVGPADGLSRPCRPCLLISMDTSKQSLAAPYLRSNYVEKSANVSVLSINAAVP